MTDFACIIPLYNFADARVIEKNHHTGARRLPPLGGRGIAPSFLDNSILDGIIVI